MATDSFVVQDDSYWQALATEYVPTGYLNGTAMGFVQVQAKLRVREKVTEYRGYSDDPFSSVTGDDTQTATAGSFSFTKYEKRIQRRRVNEAGFWRATVTERWQALFVNGQRTAGAEDSAFV